MLNKKSYSLVLFTIPPKQEDFGFLLQVSLPPPKKKKGYVDKNIHPHVRVLQEGSKGGQTGNSKNKVLDLEEKTHLFFSSQKKGVRGKIATHSLVRYRKCRKKQGEDK